MEVNYIMKLENFVGMMTGHLIIRINLNKMQVRRENYIHMAETL